MTTGGLSPAQEMRIFVGFAVQPFGAAALGFVGFPLIDLSGRALRGGTPGDPWAGAISVAVAAAFAAFIVTVCAAFPVVAWLLKRGPLSLKQVLWGGAILGNLPFAIIVPLAGVTAQTAGPGAFGPIAIARAVAAGVIFGVAGATLFWAISIRGTALERKAISSR